MGGVDASLFCHISGLFVVVFCIHFLGFYVTHLNYSSNVTEHAKNRFDSSKRMSFKSHHAPPRTFFSPFARASLETLRSNVVSKAMPLSVTKGGW
jgi:hypothetical protein